MNDPRLDSARGQCHAWERLRMWRHSHLWDVSGWKNGLAVPHGVLNCLLQNIYCEKVCGMLGHGVADVDIDRVAGSFSFGLASIFDLCWFPSGGCTLVTLSPMALCCFVEEPRSGIQALFRKDSREPDFCKADSQKWEVKMMSRARGAVEVCVAEHCS